MSPDIYDVVDEFLGQMMQHLTQSQRSDALAIVERLFCHCGHLNSVRYMAKMSVSHSPCDHVENKVDFKDLGFVDSAGKLHPGRAEVQQAHYRNQAMVMRTRFPE